MTIFKNEILPQRLELLNNLLGSQYFFVADRVTISIDLGVMQYRMLEAQKKPLWIHLYVSSTVQFMSLCMF